MQSVMSIIEQVTYQYMVGAQAARAKRIGPMVLLGLLFTAGCFFITFGFFFWLAETYATPMAAVITGLFLILISALVLAFMNYRANRERIILERRHQELMLTAQSLSAQSGEIAEELKDFTYANPKQTLAFAGLAGFLLSDFIKSSRY